MSGNAEDLATLLQDSIARYLGQAYDFERRAMILKTPGYFSVDAWKDYAEFGWLALRLPQEHGGFDADAATLGVMMENVGARLLLEPVLASAILGTGLVLRAASAEQQNRWLPQLADGSLKLAFAHEDEPQSPPCVMDEAGRIRGIKINVLHGDIADRLVLSCRRQDSQPVLCIVDRQAAGLTRMDYRLVDGRGACRLELHQVHGEILGSADRNPMLAARAIAEATDEASVALCAEATGVIRSLVSKTIQYLNLRKQFGKRIGSNQALQHRMTDMYLLQQEAIALTALAQEAFARDGAERIRAISGARAYLTLAVRRVANEAVQMHGGIGITEELDISHYFRRAMVIAGLFGNRDFHFDCFINAA